MAKLEARGCQYLVWVLWSWKEYAHTDINSTSGSTQDPTFTQTDTPHLPPDGTPQSLFKNTSTWNPINTHHNIETFATVNFSHLNKLQSTKPKFHNLSSLERQAITDLSNNKNIIIKPADKGAGVVVMNTKDYIFEAKRQLFSNAYVPSNKAF